MLNHVALLRPPLPQLSVELVSLYTTKSCFVVVYNIGLGGEGETKIVLSMFNYYVILAGIFSKVLSKIVCLFSIEARSGKSLGTRLGRAWERGCRHRDYK